MKYLLIDAKVYYLFWFHKW